MFTTDTEFNGLSSAIYRNDILHSELKILVKIYLCVIRTYMVDFHIKYPLLLMLLDTALYNIIKPLPNIVG